MPCPIPATLTPLYAAMIGGTASIVGGIIAGAWTRFLTDRSQREADARDNKKIRLEKAEELLQNLEKFKIRQRESVAKWKIASRDGLFDSVNPTDSPLSVSETLHIRAASSIYFPTLLPTIDKYEKDRNDILVTLKASIPKAVEISEAGNTVLVSLNALQQRSEDFCKALEDELLSSIADLTA